ncbi:unnamed protein product [Clonostachys rosea f. rosea IK726]|uniref:Uncharacterized protein n=1 Tax=Clonostachys rosea f. rosea IK726 TaxID=1349383 RepID=A0ACA9TZX9_BIOOC|nr:unnamed protein product [Clonostachys rosea f. rosea IK726]
MLTAPGILAGYGIVPSKWRHASTFEDVPSVYQELCKIEAQERAFILKEQGLLVVADKYFRQQCDALCSRAAFIEGGKVEATKLTDLSTELLVMILRNFQYSAPIDGTFEEDIVPKFPEEDRQTVQSLRLVSRLFNDLASPLLCPVVRLQVDHASIIRVRHITANPLVASGVRAFSISLEYRPTLLARDFQTWLRRNRQGMGVRLLTSEIAQNSSRLENVEDTDPMRRADLLEESTTLRAAWRRVKLYTVADRELRGLGHQDYVSTISREGLKDEDIARYKELIRDSHAAFASAYGHQARLTSSRSFARVVARLAAKARRPVALEFLKRVWSLPTRGRHETRTVFRSEQLLHEFLAADVGWYMRDYAAGNVRGEIPIALIADLPREIFKAGGVLGGFQLHCPPLPHHIELLPAPGAACSWFSRSFQHLKVLRVGCLNVEGEQDRFSVVSDARKRIYEQFFIALLSAPRLKEVSLEGYPFISFLVRLKLSGTVLNSLRSIPFLRARPQLKRASFSYTAPSRLNIEGLTQSLGDVDLRNLDEVSCMGADPGTAMDILRKGLRRSRIPFSSPVSSEEDAAPLFLNIVSEDQKTLADEHPTLWRELAAYMEGERLNGTPVSMWTLTYRWISNTA